MTVSSPHPRQVLTASLQVLHDSDGLHHDAQLLLFLSPCECPSQPPSLGHRDQEDTGTLAVLPYTPMCTLPRVDFPTLSWLWLLASVFVLPLASALPLVFTCSLPFSSCFQGFGEGFSHRLPGKRPFPAWPRLPWPGISSSAEALGAGLRMSLALLRGLGIIPSAPGSVAFAAITCRPRSLPPV